MTLVQRTLRNPIGWAILLILAVLLCASVFAVVPESKQAIVVRLGKPERIVNAYQPGEGIGADGAGLIARVPLLDEVNFVDKRVRSLDLTRQSIGFADGAHREVDAYTRYRVVDALRLFRTLGGDGGALDDVLRPAFATALQGALGGREASAIDGPAREAVLGDARGALARATARYGVQVLDVGITRAALPEGDPLNAAINRMRGAQEAQAAAIRDAAQHQVQSIHADADAQSSRIYQASYGQDPEFYAFYRAMQSYRQTLGGNTTAVLSPDNDYLHYFRNKGP